MKHFQDFMKRLRKHVAPALVPGRGLKQLPNCRLLLILQSPRHSCRGVD